MSNSVVINYTEGKILKPLIKFSLPILLSLMIQSLYGAIDLLIVGRFGTSADVSAVAIGSQLMQTVTGFITGLTMGITVLTGQYIGMKKYDDAGKTIGSGIFLFTVLAIVLTIICVSFSRTAVIFMQTPPEAIEKAYNYVLICSLGAVFIVAYNMISSIFRGLGNSNLPLIFVSIACVANIFGDLFFVAVLKLNTAGAAIATVLAQAISVILSYIIIRKKELPFKFNKTFIRFDKTKSLRILRLGSPIAFQDVLSHTSFLIIIAIVNGLGLTRSAGVGVAEKAVIIMLMIPLSFMSSISAFTAQNIGAKQYKRAKQALLYGVMISFICGLSIGLFAYFKGSILISLFTKDAAVIAEGKEFLRATAIESIICSTTFCLLGYFNGNGKTFFVMMQSLIAAFLVRVPFSLLMSKKPDVSMFEMGLAAPVAAVFSLLISIIYFIILEKKRKNKNLLA